MIELCAWFRAYAYAGEDTDNNFGFKEYFFGSVTGLNPFGSGLERLKQGGFDRIRTTGVLYRQEC